MRRPLDLARIQRALKRLDEVAAAHPELTQGEGGRWSDNLDELEAAMAKVGKIRQQEWRQRMAEAGFREYRAWLPPETAQRLEDVLKARGYGPGARQEGLCVIITEAVDHLADGEAGR